MTLMSPLSIVVMGAGGVGGYFGARLVSAGATVTFVARGAHLAAIQRDGLKVRSKSEGERVVKVDAVETLAGPSAVDAVLFCVKSYDTEHAAAALRPVVGPDTAVVSLQNGVDNEEKIDAALGRGHAVGGAAYVFAEIEAPGVIAHRFGGRIVFGELDGRSTPRCTRLRDALAGAGVAVEASSDIRRVLWEKYLFICAQAGLTALTRCPIGVVRGIPETWWLFRAILEEVTALARASGVMLPATIVDTLVKQGESMPGELMASLANDVVQGRRLELEALHGHAVRLGERFGIPTPAVSAVYAALKPHVDGRPQPASRA
jgi:2-dehydropantoate 2-reductase